MRVKNHESRVSLVKLFWLGPAKRTSKKGRVKYWEGFTATILSVVLFLILVTLGLIWIK